MAISAVRWRSRDLNGRVALVTGAALGMGAAHARLLAAEGARVAACDVRDEEGRRLADEVGGAYYHLDVADEDAWATVSASIGADLGPASILVNNAGVPSSSAVDRTPTEEWDRVLAINLTGSFFGIRAVTPHMRQVGGGVIVNVSSAAGLMGNANMAAYVASKWGVRGLTKAAALDLADDDIRVVSLHPGLVDTPMAAGVDVQQIAGHRPIPRAAHPDELARMLLFVIVDATFSTGCEFVADGGATTGSISR